MKIERILKTIFLADFILGLFLAIKKIFKSKKTINYQPNLLVEVALGWMRDQLKIFITHLPLCLP